MLGNYLIAEDVVDAGTPLELTHKQFYYIPATTRSLRLNMACTRNNVVLWDELYLAVNPAGAGWSANLIPNPSAETTPINQWTFTAGSWTRTQFTAGYALSSWACINQVVTSSNYLATSAASVTCYMDIDVTAYAASIDAGTCRVWYDGWWGGYNTSDVWTTLNCEFRVSAGGTVVATRSILPWASWCANQMGTNSFLSMRKLGFGYDRVELNTPFAVSRGISTWHHSDDELGIAVSTL